MDPLQTLADLILGWHKAGLVQGWLKLLFGITFSFWVSFNTVAGGCLVSGLGWPISLGSGMVAGAAMSLVAFLRANPRLTSGVVVAVPQAAVQNQFNEKGSGPTVITASGKP